MSVRLPMTAKQLFFCTFFETAYIALVCIQNWSHDCRRGRWLVGQTLVVSRTFSCWDLASCQNTVWSLSTTTLTSFSVRWTAPGLWPLTFDLTSDLSLCHFSPVGWRQVCHLFLLAALPSWLSRECWSMAYFCMYVCMFMYVNHIVSWWLTLVFWGQCFTRQHVVVCYL